MARIKSYIKIKTLDNFIFDCQKTKNTIEKLLKNNFEGIDIFAVKSIAGNGGTHLICGIYNKLEEKNKKIIFLPADQLWRWHLEKKYNYLKKVFKSNEYVFIDDFYNIDKMEQHSEYYSILLRNQGKLIISTQNKIEDCKISSIKNNSLRIKSITLNAPSSKVIKRVIEKKFNNKFNKAIIEYLSLIKIGSIKALKLLFSSIISLSVEKNLNLKGMNIEDFKKNYRKIISALEDIYEKQNNRTF